MSEPRPVDAETLAALLDGRLVGRERADLLARLAGSPELRETYADAVAALQAAEAGASRVLPLARPAAGPRRWRVAGGWLAAAAVLAGVAVGGPVLWTQLRSNGGEAGPGRFTALLSDPRAGLPAGWDAAPWSSARGPLDPLTAEARAARIGARIVDLEVAIAAEDSAAGSLAEELALLLEGVPAGAPAAAMVREVGLQAHTPSAELTELRERVTAAATELAGAEMVGLAAWAEAARIAAARRDTMFFRSAEHRQAIRSALSLATLSQPARDQISELNSSLDRKPFAWETLDRQLANLLKVLGS